MKKSLKIGFFFILFTSFLACNDTLSVEELMDQEVEKRLEKFRDKKRASCREYIMFEAEKKVDSIMYLEIGSTLRNTLPVPEKPLRPEDSMAYSVDLDTSGVYSILPDSLLLDSLKQGR
jgi:hypothetical protein